MALENNSADFGAWFNYWIFEFPIYSWTTFKNIKNNLPVITFYVNVPVLSEHMLLAPPIISHAANVFTKFCSSFILLTENAKVIVTANGNPLNNHDAKKSIPQAQLQQ